MMMRTAPAPANAAVRPATDEKIRAFVVDDSTVVRAFVTRILGAAPDIEVVGSASDGAAAVTALGGKTVDVVVLDVEMPVLDGLSALPRILEVTARPPKVVMASTLTTRGAAISIQALVKGAADYVPKPTSIGSGGAEAFATALLDRVRVWGGLALKERTAPPKPLFKSRPAATATATALPATAARPLTTLPGRLRPEVLAIGCSTGGPQALLKLFTSLKGKKLGPIFVTQHMPPTFTTLFADQLARASERPCHEAIDGEPVVDGTVYLAPGDYHMVVETSAAGPRVRRLQTPQENWCRPSVDPMFRSLATIYREKLLALVLTGMGQDGCAGAKVVVEHGGVVLAQDEATSVVWGMPGAIAQARLAREILNLDMMALRVAQLFGSPA